MIDGFDCTFKRCKIKLFKMTYSLDGGESQMGLFQGVCVCLRDSGT